MNSAPGLWRRLRACAPPRPIVVGHRRSRIAPSARAVRLLESACRTRTNLFRKGYPPRPLNPSDDPALPLYVQTPGARLRKSGERLVVETEEESAEVPMIDVSQVALFGPVSVTTPALHALMRAEIPVSWFSTGGWFSRPHRGDRQWQRGRAPGAVPGRL